jgi:uridine kinase
MAGTRGQTQMTAEEIVGALAELISPMTNRPNDRYGGDIRTVVAVSGAAALGKSHLCARLVDRLSEIGIQAQHIELDGYLLNREVRNKKRLSGYDPLSTDLSSLVSDMTFIIKKGKERPVPTYDHATGTHGDPKPVLPCRVIVLDGIASMHYEVRDAFTDFRVFLHAEELAMRSLRLHADVTGRGYSFYRALRQADSETRNYYTWIHHQIEYANVTLEVVVPDEAQGNVTGAADGDTAAALGERLLRPMPRAYLQKGPYQGGARKTGKRRGRGSTT